MSGPALSALTIADGPEPWSALGFQIDAHVCSVGGVEIRFDAGSAGSAGSAGAGITGWRVAGLIQSAAIDGLLEAERENGSATGAEHHVPSAEHPNGALAVDHVVVTTPDFDRTAAALAAAGMPLKRIREGDGFRQGFRRLGPAILELVQAGGGGPGGGPARFWGVTFTVVDLPALADRLGERLKPIRPAVQPGRRIAALSRDAGLSTSVAFMTPEP